MVQEEICGEQMKYDSFNEGAEVTPRVLSGFSSAK